MRNPVILILILLLISGVNGCGSGSSRKSTSPDITPVEGRVIQGPVDGAVVFADKNANRVRDDDEVWTESDRSGRFVLGVPDNYGAYRLVSQGGVDVLTGKYALPMLAPAGITTMTPLTTLVALAPEDQQQAVIDKLESIMKLGSVTPRYDVDHAAEEINYRVLAVIKAIEQSLIVVRDVFGITRPDDLLSVMQSMSSEIANPDVTLSSLSDLGVVLPAAIVNSVNVQEMMADGDIESVKDVLSAVTHAVVEKVRVDLDEGGSVTETEKLSRAVEVVRLKEVIDHQVTLDAAVITVRLSLAPMVVWQGDSGVTEEAGSVIVTAADVTRVDLTVVVFNNTKMEKTYENEQLELVIRDRGSDRSARFRVSAVDVTVAAAGTVSIDFSRARLDVTATNSQGNEISTQSVTNDAGGLNDLVTFDQENNQVRFFMENIQQKLAERVADDFANITLQGEYTLSLTANQVPLLPRSVEVVAN